MLMASNRIAEKNISYLRMKNAMDMHKYVKTPSDRSFVPIHAFYPVQSFKKRTQLGNMLRQAYQSFIEESCCGFPLAAFKGLAERHGDITLLLALLVQE